MLHPRSGLTIAALFLSAISGYDAFACQCSRVAPEYYYERSDAIFTGRATSIDRNTPLDEATHVTFDVSKSWKGIDTKAVTIRTGDGTGCGYYSFKQGQEYLVYGTKQVASINVDQCGGTASFDSPFVNLDLAFLENKHALLELKAGHTMSVNILPIMTVLGSLVAISIAAFVIIRKRA
jgi:hypothetical protein